MRELTCARRPRRRQWPEFDRCGPCRMDLRVIRQSEVRKFMICPGCSATFERMFEPKRRIS